MQHRCVLILSPRGSYNLNILVRLIDLLVQHLTLNLRNAIFLLISIGHLIKYKSFPLVPASRHPIIRF